MNHFFSAVKRKIEATVGIWRARDIHKTIFLAPTNEARARIDEILRTYSNSPKNSVDLKTVSDEILCAIKEPKRKPTSQRLEKLVDGVLSQAIWYHSQLAGLTTVWEFRIRIFGNKLGIRPNVPIEEKSKKNKANNSVEHRPLSDTIKEIEKKTGQRLNMKLLELCELRNAIVHCNPQGIRAYAIPLFGKRILEPVRGNVVVFTLNDGTAKNMSDMKDEESIEEQDIFGWFLEIFNSRLPEMAFQCFETSIAQLDLLIEFSASSFDGRENVFQNLLISGKKPSKEEISLFNEYFSSPYCPVKREADSFFQDVFKCFKSLDN